MYNHVDNKSKAIKFMREAGAVRRCHTIPIIGEYNVAIHVYNMLAMLRLLYPDAPLPLIWAIIEHDIPERLTGDIPAPTKWFGAIDKERLNQLEHEITKSVVGYDHCAILSYEEERWLKALDILELALFCRDQIMIGNKNMAVMLDRIHKFVKRESASFEPAVLDVYWELFNEDWLMMPDLGDV